MVARPTLRPLRGEAARLARDFGGSVQHGMNLQMTYELRKAEIESEAQIAREVIPREAA